METEPELQSLKASDQTEGSNPSQLNKSSNQYQGKGAHKWSGKIHVEQNLLKDDYGRTILLRGVNLTGHSKLPTGPPNSTHHGKPEFFDHKNITFVGRPFTSGDAHEHFERLSRWGLTFARVLVTWEALGTIFLTRTLWSWHIR
jgi:hypothetical protein